MPALEITQDEWATHIANMGRTHEIRNRLRGPVVRTPQREAPRVIVVRVVQDAPAPRKELPRHPSDFARYKFPLSLPAPNEASGRNRAKWTPVELIRQVAEDAGLNAEQLRSSSRVARYVRPRQFAMWLVKQRIPHMSLPQIGRAFGGRDHTTVLHACRKVDRLIREGVIDPLNPHLWFRMGAWQ